MVGTPALAAGETSHGSYSSGVGAQGSVLGAFSSSAPSRMKDTETKPLLGTTVDSKGQWKKKSFHQSSCKVAAFLMQVSAKTQNTPYLQRVGLDGIFGRNSSQ